MGFMRNGSGRVEGDEVGKTDSSQITEEETGSRPGSLCAQHPGHGPVI